VRSPKVRLYIRVRLHDGRDAFVDPIWNRNRTLRGGYGLIKGQPEHHPEGSYYLRFLRDGKRVWQPVGSAGDAAVAALHNTQRNLQSVALGRSVPVADAVPPVSVPESSVSLKNAIQLYLEEVRRFRSPKTIAACEHMLNLFGSKFPGRNIKEITRKDLLDHMSFLKEKGLGTAPFTTTSCASAPC
jgi:integrase/recombinase XerD